MLWLCKCVVNKYISMYVVTFMGVYKCSRFYNPMWCLSCMYHKYAVVPIGTNTKLDPWVLSAPEPWHCLAKNIHNYSWMYLIFIFIVYSTYNNLLVLAWVVYHKISFSCKKSNVITIVMRQQHLRCIQILIIHAINQSFLKKCVHNYVI